MKRTNATLTLNDTTQSHERYRNFEKAEEAEEKAMSNIFSDEKPRAEKDLFQPAGIVATAGAFSETDDLFSREEDDENIMRFTVGSNSKPDEVESVVKHLNFVPP